jgi:uncharacterized protein
MPNTRFVERIADAWVARYRPSNTHEFARDRQQRMILVGRHADALIAAAAAINRQHGVMPIILELDVTATDAIPRIEEMLALHQMHLAVLVNNAGVGNSGAFADASPAALEQLVALNITALTSLTRHFLPGMLARGRGGILNIASLGGLTPGPYQATYYASKAYVISLTHAIKAECAGKGIRVSVVAPGPVNTRFHERMGTESAYYRRLIPAPSAEFVARVAVRGFRWGRTTIIPGWSWTILAATMKLSPLAIATPVVSWLLKPR